MPAQFRLKPLLWSAAALLVLLAATACSNLDGVARLLDRPDVRVPSELSGVWEVYDILERDFGGIETVDQEVLSHGAIEAMLSILREHQPSTTLSSDYDLTAPDLQAVWQAWADILPILDQADVSVTAEELEQAAIRGMLSALGNPYTAYLSPDRYELEFNSFSSNYEGIGAYMGLSDSHQLTISALIPNTPAEQAGIVAGDVILDVDGTSTQGMSVTEVVLLIRGPEGTSVDLLVLHRGQDYPEIVTIIRGTVFRPSVVWEPLTDDVAYMRISEFLEDTGDEVEDALEEILARGFSGLVLDLRNNAGGLLRTTVEVASLLLEEGPVLYQTDAQGNRKDVKLSRDPVAPGILLVLVVDGTTASGSEILAGALQDHERAIIVGTMTFGKGSVNQFRRLEDGSGLYLTFALWYTPNGWLIEGEGLTPDIFVPTVPDDLLGTRRDSQLNVALSHIIAVIQESAASRTVS
ncbi:MAG: S41 family peptidase [Chloroflexi bacterium]|nr:S41 family peptidase [Chloroflexota bacterium]